MKPGTLGKGGFSEVDLEIIEQKFYACKKIDLSGYSINYLLAELNCLRCLQHPNIVKCYGFNVRSFKFFNLYFEYIKGSTINKAYTNNQSEELLFFWIFQIAQALDYLQTKGIIHRDIKPSNIMVSQTGLVKLIDFGVSKFLPNNNKFSLVGSPSYIAPEVITRKSLCHLSDIWSLGVTIYQLIHKRLPFQQQGFLRVPHSNIFYKICDKNAQCFQFSCSQQMKSLLKRMLCKDHQKRISAKQILNHSSIKSREGVLRMLYFKSLESK